MEENEKKEESESQLNLTSLDIIAWAYLKEALVNNHNSPYVITSLIPCQVLELRSKHPLLIAFVERLDGYFNALDSGALQLDQPLSWDQAPDKELEIINSL